MDGILLVDKPKGWTSFDVIAKVRGLIRQITGQKILKVGHTGTLDPQATGLLVIVIGSYTKRVAELTKVDKTYKVTMKLGEISSTGDTEGEMTVISNTIPSKRTVKYVLLHFVGKIEQTPPRYSAVKVNGQRAYKLARAGKDFIIEPRAVTIYDISEIDYSYPIIKFTTKVSSGTYIRSLVEDIGKKLTTGAYMTDLCRYSVGEFNLANSQTIEDIQLKGMDIRQLP